MPDQAKLTWSRTGFIWFRQSTGLCSNLLPLEACRSVNACRQVPGGVQSSQRHEWQQLKGTEMALAVGWRAGWPLPAISRRPPAHQRHVPATPAAGVLCPGQATEGSYQLPQGCMATALTSEALADMLSACSCAPALSASAASCPASKRLVGGGRTPDSVLSSSAVQSAS